jgi:membrane protein YdbS with pleckstrin-like domain
MSGPAGGRPPRWAKDAAKYLLPGEQAVVATRRHWAVLLWPLAKTLPVLLAGLWLLTLDPGNPVGSTLGLLVVLGALGTVALRVGEWWMRHFLVTRRRVLLTSGIVVRTVTLLPLRRITDLTWKETLLGQVLGYGTFRFESAGQQQALSQITFLPRADLLYREVSSLLFGSDWSGGGGGDDEGNPDDGGGDQGGRAVDDGGQPATSGSRRDTQPIPRLPGAPGGT